MKLVLNNISQTDLPEVINNPIDAKPSRIKEKPESLLTTIANCVNVPFVRKEVKPIIKEEKVEQSPKAKMYTVISTSFKSAAVTGKAKMINVKDKMLENIKKMSKSEPVKIQPVIEEKKEPVVENNYFKNDIPNFEKNIPIGVSKSNSIEPKNTSVERDFDFEKIIKEQETKAASVIESRKAANESERKLQEVVVEQTESEKRYQEELARKEDLMRKLQAIMNNRSNIFEKETSTNENKIKENNEQIMKVQQIIDSNNKKTDLLKEQNDKMQSLYEAANMRLQSFGQYNDDEEQYRRVA